VPPSSIRPESVIDAPRLVEPSCQCGSVISIQPPAADQPVAGWICKTCRAAYFGGVSSSKNRGVELLVGTNSNSHTGDGLSDPIGESILTKEDVTSCGSATDTLAGRDRRQQTRYSIGVPVVAVPLRSDFSIAGPAMRMTTRDISQSGIAWRTLALAMFRTTWSISNLLALNYCRCCYKCCGSVIPGRLMRSRASLSIACTAPTERYF
jgi:hypothetical protein